MAPGPDPQRFTGPVVLALICAAALGLRLNGIGQGLPGLYDPDEPLFLINGLQLLRDQTLQPGWFGHPGTTLLYLLAAIDIAAYLAGLASGAWADPAGYAQRLYTDASPAVLPARIAIALMAVGVIAATARLGTRLGDRTAGLAAAVLLAASPLHVELSQLVRTDVMMSLFALLALLATQRFAETRAVRPLVVAGVWLGVAIATKWPAALFLLAPLGIIWRECPSGRRLRLAAILGAATLATMLLLMPPLWRQPLEVWAALRREAQPAHVGATGGDLLFNLGWYLKVLARALSLPGLVLALAGVVLLIVRRQRLALLLLALPALALLLVLATQANVWQRWMVPLLPPLALLAGFALSATARQLARLAGHRSALAPPLAAMLCLGAGLASARASWSETSARATPTQARAAAWAVAHLPPGSSVTVEMLAFPLLAGGFDIRFPLGSRGCPDGRGLLSARVNHGEASSAQAGRQKIVLGTVSPRRLAGCRADYVIIHDHWRWQAERSRYPVEAWVYDDLLRTGRIIARFDPAPGRSAGPQTLIVSLRGRPQPWISPPPGVTTR